MSQWRCVALLTHSLIQRVITTSFGTAAAVLHKILRATSPMSFSSVAYVYASIIKIIVPYILSCPYTFNDNNYDKAENTHDESWRFV